MWLRSEFPTKRFVEIVWDRLSMRATEHTMRERKCSWVSQLELVVGLGFGDIMSNMFPATFHLVLLSCMTIQSQRKGLAVSSTWDWIKNRDNIHRVDSPESRKWQNRSITTGRIRHPHAWLYRKCRGGFYRTWCRRWRRSMGGAGRKHHRVSWALTRKSTTLESRLDHGREG